MADPITPQFYHDPTRDTNDHKECETHWRGAGQLKTWPFSCVVKAAKMRSEKRPKRWGDGPGHRPFMEEVDKCCALGSAHVAKALQFLPSPTLGAVCRRAYSIRAPSQSGERHYPDYDRVWPSLYIRPPTRENVQCSSNTPAIIESVVRISTTNAGVGQLLRAAAELLMCNIFIVLNAAYLALPDQAPRRRT